mmetsp:Transcript_8362/g.13561  ORF Transcript_8362/g.13561 Transcript_8362/m.13561 type:complete len:118 (+) Transcript_8362:2071-2424(+)
MMVGVSGLQGTNCPKNHPKSRKTKHAVHFACEDADTCTLSLATCAREAESMTIRRKLFCKRSLKCNRALLARRSQISLKHGNIHLCVHRKFSGTITSRLFKHRMMGIGTSHQMHVEF